MSDTTADEFLEDLSAEQCGWRAAVEELLRWLDASHCGEYFAPLARRLRPLPDGLESRNERGALHAVRDLLARLYNEPPTHLTQEQREEFVRLRDLAIRLVQQRLRENILGHEVTARAEKAVEDKMAFDGLRAIAMKLGLKGHEAEIVQQICDGLGSVPMGNLTASFGWQNPDDNWNSAAGRLNKKLKKHGWQFLRNDSCAIVRQLAIRKPTGRK